MERYGEIELPDFLYEGLSPPLPRDNWMKKSDRVEIMERRNQFKIDNPDLCKLKKVMINDSWIIHGLKETESRMCTTLSMGRDIELNTSHYYYDNYGNCLALDGIIEKSGRDKPMTNEQIDMFKNYLTDSRALSLVNSLIDEKTIRNEEIKNLRMEIDDLKTIVKNLCSFK